MTDGSQDRITAIRDLLLRAFSLSELDQLFFYAFEYPRLQKARGEFTPSDSLGERVLKVLDYCVRRDLLDELLALIEQERPEQSQALLDDLVGELPTDQIERLLERGYRIAEAREPVARAKVSLKYNCQQIQLMSEYKDAHDLLQQLEEAYHLLYDSLYGDSGAVRPLEEGAWHRTAQSRGALQRRIIKLLEEIEAMSFRASAAEWLDTLRQSKDDLQAAYDGKDECLLVTTLCRIYDVISSRTSPINDRLIGTIDALRLPDLVQELQSVYQSVETYGNGAVALELQDDQKAVSELDRMSERLVARRKEHDAWQDLDKGLRTEVEVLTASRDVDRFRLRWETILRGKMLALCPPSQTDREQSPDTIRNLDEALGTAGVEVDYIINAFNECRSEAANRFVVVDCALKRLCDALAKAGAWWSAALERVP